MEHEIDNMITGLLKKDGDIQILDIDETNGTIDFQTTIQNFGGSLDTNIYNIYPEEQSEPDQMMDVDIEILVQVFLANAIIAFYTLNIGIIPYAMLANLSQNTANYLAASLLVVASISYITMIFFRSLVSIVIWASCFAFGMGALAFLLNDISPLQTCSIIFVQSLSFIVYANISRRAISGKMTALLMFISGGVTWLVGIYVFIEQKDWITGVILVGLVILFAVYSVIYVLYGERYSLSNEHIAEAVCQYLGMPIYFILKKCYRSEIA